MNTGKYTVMTKILLLTLLLAWSQNKSFAFGGLTGALEEKVVKPMSGEDKPGKVKAADMETVENLYEEEPQRDQFYPGETLSQAIDQETGNIVSLVRWPDGSTRIVETNSNGTTLSELELAVEDAARLLSNEEGIIPKINRLPDGSIEISQYDKDGNLISQEQIDESDMLNVSTYDPETGITTTREVNEDGSTTITETDQDGFMVSQETVTPEKKVDEKERGKPYKLADGSFHDPKTGITTTSVKNPDGSRTITKTDKENNVISKEVFPPKGQGLSEARHYDPETGKTTTVIQNADGSKSIVKSKTTTDPDGTQHTTAMDEEGNSINTMITPEGIVKTTKTDIYGNTKETIMNEDGSITSVEKTVDGYTIETSKAAGGEAVIVKRDLDGSVMETMTSYTDGTRVHFDKHGNMTEELPVNEDGEIWTVETDKKGNEKVSVKNTMGEVLHTEENRVTPKELGREYYEKVVGGSSWDDLPSSTKTRYAGNERRMRENAALEDLRAEQVAKDEKVAKQEGEWLKKSHKKLDKDLMEIKDEQKAADRVIAERKAKRDRKLELQESYEKADKLQKQYDEAIKKGEKKEAKRIERLQDEHHEKSMDVLAFTKEEEKDMQRKSKLRQELMEQISREARFEAEKADLERIKYDEYKDVGMEAGSWLSVGAEQQRDLAESNRQEERLLSYTAQKDKIIERMLNNKDLTSEQRDILIDTADMSSLQRIGALEKKAANNRIVAAGYAIDAAMLATGGIGNVAVGVGSKVVGKAVAVKVAAKATAKGVVKGMTTKTALKEAIKKGAKAGEKYTDGFVRLANYDVKTAASKKVIEKVVARKTAKKVLARKLEEGVGKKAAEATAKKVGDRVGKRVAKEAGKEISEKGLINTAAVKAVEKTVAKKTAKKVLAKKLEEGVGKKAAEATAKKVGDRVGKRVAKEVGKEISEKGLINTAGSKAGGKLAEKVAGKKTGVAVEKALAKKRSLFPKDAVKAPVKQASAKTAAKAPTQQAPKTSAKTGAKAPVKQAPKAPVKTAKAPAQQAPKTPTLKQTKPAAKTAAKVPTPKTPPAKTAKAPMKQTPKTSPKAVAKAPTPKTTKRPIEKPAKPSMQKAPKTPKERVAKAPTTKKTTKTPTEKPAKKPSEMTPSQRQAHNDALAQKEVSKKWREKAPLEDGGDDLLPSPTGKATDRPVGELSRNLTPKEVDTLFKPGANLTRKQIQQKADLLLKRRMDAKVSMSTGKTVPPHRYDPSKTLPPPTSKTLPPPGKYDPSKTLPPPVSKTLPPPGRLADDTATIIFDDPLKGAVRGGGKRGTQVLKPDDTIVDYVGEKSIMPKRSEWGMPRKKVGGMPKGRPGGVGQLAKGHPRGLPEGKVGGHVDLGILSAPDGTLVKDARPFGILPSAMKDFQKKINKAKLRAAIRPTGDAALALRRAGHPPKHVKIKGKTINDVDVKLGAKPGSQGQAGYFEPKKPKNYDSLEASRRKVKKYKQQLENHEKMGTPKPEKPDNYDSMVQDSKLLDRFEQRSKEYLDNARDMQKLVKEGLISIEDGVVVDRGLSNTRLGKDGKLHYDREGPMGGTGKGFRGDHDLWDITHPDGRPIQTDPTKANFDKDALKRRDKLLEALGQGPTEAQHGPHKYWDPVSKRDIGIDRKIRKSHFPGGEGLLELLPDQPPRVTYEGATMPKKKDWGLPKKNVGGMPDDIGMPKENVGGITD